MMTMGKFFVNCMVFSTIWIDLSANCFEVGSREARQIYSSPSLPIGEDDHEYGRVDHQSYGGVGGGHKIQGCRRSRSDPDADCIPGHGGIDYPIFTTVPSTGFTCSHYPHQGYFADVEAHCQVFHICEWDGRQHSILCPKGTIFNQQVLVCDWWYNVDCYRSLDLYTDIYARRENYLDHESHHMDHPSFYYDEPFYAERRSGVSESIANETTSASTSATTTTAIPTVTSAPNLPRTRPSQKPIHDSEFVVREMAKMPMTISGNEKKPIPNKFPTYGQMKSKRVLKKTAFGDKRKSSKKRNL